MSGVHQIQKAVCWHVFGVSDTMVNKTQPMIGVEGKFWRDSLPVMGAKL